MAAHIAGYHLAIDEIEKGCLIAGDKQGTFAYRDPDIIGFGPLYGDGKKDGSPA
jgi:hypothetical protein